MNIFTQLKSEHDELKDLFKRIETTTERAEKGRTELFALLDKKLSSHAEGEEATVYSKLKTGADDPAMILEAYEEHGIAKQLLAELRDLPPTHERFGPKIVALREVIEHHVKEEESEIFKLGRKLWDSEQQEAIGAEYLEARDELQSRFVPGAGGESERQAG